MKLDSIDFVILIDEVRCSLPSVANQHDIYKYIGYALQKMNKQPTRPMISEIWDILEDLGVINYHSVSQSIQIKYNIKSWNEFSY